MPRFLRPLSLFALLLFSIFSLGAFGTDEPDGDGKAKPFLLTNDERAAILDLFNATEETVSKEGVVELVYNFETEERTLSDDWIPPLTRKNRAVRWSRDWEGSAEGLAGGILIADSGQWFHSAVWQPEVEIEATYVSFCGGSRGDMVVAVYAWTKGLKRRVGS
ncbi:MAG TPA: hypothetical protein EYN00_03105, partial [Planctomycetes bacterium]|nr:hypothetical protein [Planctomycetota bacterium]